MAQDEGIWSTAVNQPLSVTSLGGDIDGVPDTDMRTIRELTKVWQKNYPYNLIRTAYYLEHYRFKDFGISIPDRIKANVSACVGWPAKAVRSLADLSRFDGWSIEEGDNADKVNEITRRTSLGSVVSEAAVSAYMHGCSFITVTADPDDPRRAVVTPRSAEYSAAIWDGVHNRLSAVLTINDADSKGNVQAFNVFLPWRTYSVRRDGGRWVLAGGVQATNWPEPNAIPFVSDPQLSRPLGRARITPSLMALTDMGFRTLVRMEASAEFYAVPKLWFLGADEDAFNKDTWTSLISAINSIGLDEDGNRPELKQVSQASMQPHSDMLRTIALMVASETDLTVDSLGITLDNPGSAEAMAAAERRLTRTAERQNGLFGGQLVKLMQMAVAQETGTAMVASSTDMADTGLPVLADDLRDLTPVWLPVREISDAARADAYQKVSAANESYATSSVGLRRLGLTTDEIASLRSEMKRAQGRDALQQLVSLNGGGERDEQDTEPQPDNATGRSADERGGTGETRTGEDMAAD